MAYLVPVAFLGELDRIMLFVGILYWYHCLRGWVSMNYETLHYQCRALVLNVKGILD